jgi:hypothetical protein
MNLHPGWMLVVVGLTIALVGLAWMFAPGIGWLGRLPGDIRIENESTRIYIPITTCILLSIVLSTVIWIARRLWQ